MNCDTVGVINVIKDLKMKARLIIYLAPLAIIANSCITDDCSCVSKLYEKHNFCKVYFLLLSVFSS